MFGKNAYNKAVDSFHKLRKYPPDSPSYERTLLDVIRYSKEAINKNRNDGDAHILLANAYYLASMTDFPSDNFSRYFPLAAAVIYEWKTRPMYSKAKENGENIYQGVLERDLMMKCQNGWGYQYRKVL